MKHLIACGGTGAHVALAFMRFHLLGSPLGLFRRPVLEQDLIFPDIYLVDQDSGDGVDEHTAWRLVRELYERHPGQYNWEQAGGRIEEPILQSISPLPVGPENRDSWYNPPNNTLSGRFGNSPLLDILASNQQKGIDYSLGMMGSPAIGSLLFYLKEFDRRPDEQEANNDFEYTRMQNRCRKGDHVVVTGSGVGGTGASVGPTLAELCFDKGAAVMAVMIQQWFQFGLDTQDEELFEKARVRNAVMEENAAAGLASYGQTLARKAAAVLVGVQRSNLKEREFTSDNQQATLDSHTHAVAALSAIQHFTRKKPFRNGIWGMSASDQSKLTGDLSVGDKTLQDLANQAGVFLSVITTFARSLRNASPYAKEQRHSALYNAMVRQVGSDRMRDVGHEILDTFVRDYKVSIDWLADLGVAASSPIDREISSKFTREASSRTWLREHAVFSETYQTRQRSTQEAASALFYWTAKWVNSKWTENLVEQQSLLESPQRMTGGYWPEQYDTSLAQEWGDPGTLIPVSRDKIPATLGSLYKIGEVSHNGWPHHIAVSEHFRFQLKNGLHEAVRQLEILLTGLAMGELRVETIENYSQSVGGRLTPSLECLGRKMQEQESEQAGFGQFRIVGNGSSSSKVFAVNDPIALFCPVPSMEDAAWQELWEQLNGHRDATPWNSHAPRWSFATQRARGCIKTWIENFNDGLDSGDLPLWARRLPFSSAGIRSEPPDWLETAVPIRLESGKTFRIPLPVQRRGQHHAGFDFSMLDPIELDEKHFGNELPEFEAYEDFQLCKGVKIPGHGGEVRLIWQEHLEELQKSKLIAYWDFNKTEDTLRIGWDMRLGSIKVVYLHNTRVINLEQVRIDTCIPLPQQHVPNSPAAATKTKYPDLPLKHEYICLVKTSDGRDLTELLLNGVSDENELTTGSPPTISTSGRRREASWILNLKGRSKPVEIAISVHNDSCQAHWMVWPRFRAKAGQDAWRPYYTYTRSTRQSLETRFLFERQGEIVIQDNNRRLVTSDQGAVSFDSSKRRHTGGPPLAAVAYDKNLDCEVGVYIVKLKVLDRSTMPWALAIDFGTSHSLAAAQSRSQPSPGVVSLKPEFEPGKERAPLTYHVSEDYDPAGHHFESWFPTYVANLPAGADALIPSELLAVKSLKHVTSSNVEAWEPIRDYTIPAMEPQRSDLRERVIANLKWDVMPRSLSDAGKTLREYYMGMALEIFIADRVLEFEVLPSVVNLTFMYPLRFAVMGGQIRGFEDSIGEVLNRGTEDLGCELNLVKNEGLYSESHAAKGGKSSHGEVILVGDLGGGTLDLLILANDRQNLGFGEVADSVALGGDRLLDVIATNPKRYLPDQAGWSLDDIEGIRCGAELRAWMRVLGSHNLFGHYAGNVQHRGLGLRSFEDVADANNSRELIDRYFSLVANYMARSLVAFIGKDIWKKIPSPDQFPLKIVVQLCGNGWRLWYGSDEYGEIQQHMTKLIRRHAQLLWEQVAMAAPNATHWPSRKIKSNYQPKIAPVTRVVGKSLGPKKARAMSYKFPLTDLELFLGMEQERRAWHERLPFQGVSDAELEIGKLSPPIDLLLSADEGASPVVRIVDLEEHLMEELNEGINNRKRTGSNRLDAPVAELLWERVFQSSQFTSGIGED